MHSNLNFKFGSYHLKVWKLFCIISVSALEEYQNYRLKVSRSLNITKYFFTIYACNKMGIIMSFSHENLKANYQNNLACAGLVPSDWQVLNCKSSGPTKAPKSAIQLFTAWRSFILFCFQRINGQNTTIAEKWRPHLAFLTGRKTMYTTSTGGWKSKFCIVLI